MLLLAVPAPRSLISILDVTSRKELHPPPAATLPVPPDSLANAVAETSRMCYQERMMRTFLRCRNSFIACSDWVQCQEAHDAF